MVKYLRISRDTNSQLSLQPDEEGPFREKIPRRPRKEEPEQNNFTSSPRLPPINFHLQPLRFNARFYDHPQNQRNSGSQPKHQNPDHSQSARGFHGRLVALYPVDLAGHDVLEAVRPGTLRLEPRGVPVAAVRIAVLAKGGREDQAELVTWKNEEKVCLALLVGRWRGSKAATVTEGSLEMNAMQKISTTAGNF